MRRPGCSSSRPRWSGPYRMGSRNGSFATVVVAFRSCRCADSFARGARPIYWSTGTQRRQSR
eukprot:6121072-Lingulodinium_polyedra.AAC.1